MTKRALLAVILAGCSSLALAEAGADLEKFVAADTNSDGVLSEQEAQLIEGLAGRFDEADADADGSLTRDEYAQAMGAQKKQS